VAQLYSLGVSRIVKSATHNFLKVSGGVPFFARVSIEPSVLPSGLEIVVAPTAIEAPKDYEQYRGWPAAAERGVRYALSHSDPPQASGIRILITSILGTEVDTTPDAVATAACFATWDALEIVGTHPPRLEGREFVFEL
jgi:hypothetical protein